MMQSIRGTIGSLRKPVHAKKLTASGFSNLHSSAKVLSPLNSFEEIQVPVPWGHVSGKWWGRKDVTPIIGLHGFEDNAGTYDRLAPILDVEAFLAWDAPGHGRSSHVPVGMAYTFVDFIITLRHIIKHHGWKNISIIGHSFGSCMGHIYASLYPSEVEKFVSLDCARIFMAELGNSGMKGLPLLRKQVQKNLKADSDISKEPPAYELEDMIDVFYKATSCSVYKENAHYLLNRGATAHPTIPNKLYFTRDQKLRYSEFNRPSLEVLTESAQNIKCHVLSILGTEGFINLAAKTDIGKAFFQLEDHVKGSAATYQRVNVVGTHHVHLNNPERVAPLINKLFAQ
ncbi:hypothetical protein ONE63_004352 [Megalurothrips usitatus]|uniref:AB hydrolase-1 domain-containing protein n=1 Tax=Megalurothrips usitatus TaxID=439358 RepID=A0AAV7X2J6_9NEOP|nr:hypothetical protein ONE63_004352 [Megalurothrips usitatus]